MGSLPRDNLRIMRDEGEGVQPELTRARESQPPKGFLSYFIFLAFWNLIDLIDQLDTECSDRHWLLIWSHGKSRGKGFLSGRYAHMQKTQFHIAKRFHVTYAA